MPNKGGFLDKLKDELFESDSPKATPAPKSAPVASAPPPAAPPVISGTTPYTFGTTPMPASGPAPIDADAMAAVNDGVFGGGDTHYTHFMKMFDVMGRPADPTVVLKAMQAMDGTITGAAILKDINDHLSRLDAVTAKATSDFDAVAQQRLGGADTTLAQLQQANDAAAAEIARHNKETADRMTQIAQVTQQRATDEVAITQAKAKTEAAEAAVKQQLTGMQALFSALPPQ
jgi:hypothetical protein